MDMSLLTAALEGEASADPVMSLLQADLQVKPERKAKPTGKSLRNPVPRRRTGQASQVSPERPPVVLDGDLDSAPIPQPSNNEGKSEFDLAVDPATVPRPPRQAANVNASTNSGETALYMAAMNNHESIIKLLVNTKSQRTNLDAANVHGFTAVMVAAHNRHMKIVKHLVVAKADITCVNEDGECAMDIAKRRGFMDIISVLKGESLKVAKKKKTKGKPPPCTCHLCSKDAMMDMKAKFD